MNKQGNKTNPFGGIEWTHIFGPGTGYTANPVRGCQHQCRWRMPDGKVATCYAEAQRDRLNGAGAFQHVTFHPEVLDAIRKHKTPAGIFIDSMADLFSMAVETGTVWQVLDTMRECPQHIFFALTKNAGRLATRAFQATHFPPNLCLGVSLPPTFMHGKELSQANQWMMFDKALDALCKTDAAVKWVSLEPLSWDCSQLLAKYQDKLHWAVIGAASDGARTYQPNADTLNNVLATLDCAVFFKGNLNRELAVAAAGGWLAEFPWLDKV